MANHISENIKSYLSFQVGNEIFATNVANILNILEMSKITRVPRSPRYMKGVMNLRGSVLPVLDTRIKFGLQETDYTNNTCILVFELTSKTETLRLGAIVDNVQEVLELEKEDILPPPSIGTNFNSKFITGMAKRADNFIMLLNIDSIFNHEENIKLQEIGPE